MHFIENIRESARSIRQNKGRTFLTVLLIGVGLAALIGVLTSMDGLKFWYSHQFATMGTNSFQVTQYGHGFRREGGERKNVRPVIQYRESEEFKSKISDFAIACMSGIGTFNASVKYGNNSSKENLLFLGVDENFNTTSDYEIERGRGITASDVEMRSNVAVIGKDVEKVLFKRIDPLDKNIFIEGKTYRIIGVFAEKGMQSMVGGDKIVTIPVSTLFKDKPDPNRNYTISVFVKEASRINEVAGEAEGIMRKVRGLRPREESDFTVLKQDAMLSEFLSNLSVLTISAIVIALLTLGSAAVALMNIMLVSVTERTREIGIRKATGATRGNIRSQFLTEAIFICQIGGFAGIVLGIGAGSLVSMGLEADFAMPWNWVALGLIICFIVGTISGYYPAWKASRIDPIDSLRYE